MKKSHIDTKFYICFSFKNINVSNYGRFMRIHFHDDKLAMGRAAAKDGAGAIRSAIAEAGAAAVIVATGASQFEMLDALVSMEIDWSKVTLFHLDEYVGIAPDHPASFRGYLYERLIKRIGPLKDFIAVKGDAVDLDAEIARLNERIARESIDVCFAGIGENCHLAFNDPPADFRTESPFLVVELDEACRRQQMGEGWFVTLDEVPRRAISMSIRQIMNSGKLVLSVPDARKADAVRNAVEGEVSDLHPASICQEHADAGLYLDPDSASRLSSRTG
ncbi:glucosamine-6-phosphate deaminase [Pelagibius sp. Alg239-R121]|uniref:glucosamine-6-phosphate deaminase n=1 Tax=Pelagibius sp. Alg239-R121 TaxID=2993448 RepID=UPI0024A7A01D|nr:glucosamine-6-phosphate deaminase [Pelagibius sp. Alg239-R121]